MLTLAIPAVGLGDLECLSFLCIIAAIIKPKASYMLYKHSGMPTPSY